MDNHNIIFENWECVNYLCVFFRAKSIAYQEIIRLDTKEFSKISKSHWCICFESEVTVHMSWGEVATLSDKNRRKLCLLKLYHSSVR